MTVEINGIQLCRIEWIIQKRALESLSFLIKRRGAYLMKNKIYAFN